MLTFLRLIWHMTVTRPELRGDFLRTLIDCLRHNPNALGPISTAILMYAHIGPFSRYVIDKVDQQIAEIDAGRWQTPAVIAPSAPPVEERAPVMVPAK